ncbi:Putative trans-acting enoyl reductase [Corynebacterium ciconiae DSM 44920]|uniref:saccharopine dehydrogenase family protein n=1 Tax=Corynebacterium ciconiae TaxID=227319 RepID=UPI000377B5E5|nr:saccharopine dehydrogenase NADP-binding domain-containing protein [Corynebacterium ciconiae]WKD60236.1 Putative trans-acting enoyl reductase [Corynebacterium ciconiae DSM 44920]
MSSTNPPRECDILLFGATSFVGKLVAQYLLEHASHRRLCFAGRSAPKLAALYGECSVPLRIADASDPASMAELARSARVVITTVGPYARYGWELVRACAEAGTHYLDLSGEAEFVQDSVCELDDVAAASGAKIMHSCGFDSVPSDLACWLLAEHCGGQLGHVEMVVSDLVGGVSGGTIASMLNSLRTGRPAARHPYALNNELFGPSPEQEASSRPRLGRGQSLAPFFMAGYNVRLVRRSAWLMGYGPDFRYSEVHDLGSRPRALAFTAVLGTIGYLAQRDWGQRIVERIFPAPGEGPSDTQQAAGRFTVTTTERAGGSSVRIHLDRDPGYAGTALMISEIALSLLDPDSPATAGVLTPATGGGAAAVRRLAAAGMEISTPPRQAS